MTIEQKPTVGRVVHYQPLENDPIVNADQFSNSYRTGQPWPAIITEIVDDTAAVRLDIRTPSARCPDPIYDDGVYEFAETPTPGRWSWPPR